MKAQQANGIWIAEYPKEKTWAEVIAENRQRMEKEYNEHRYCPDCGTDRDTMEQHEWAAYCPVCKRQIRIEELESKLERIMENA